MREPDQSSCTNRKASLLTAGCMHGERRSSYPFFTDELLARHIPVGPGNYCYPNLLLDACEVDPTACTAQDRQSVLYSQYSTVQYSTVQYSTVQYSTVQYSSMLSSPPRLHSPTRSQLSEVIVVDRQADPARTTTLIWTVRDLLHHRRCNTRQCHGELSPCPLQGLQ